jgi:hypothetical protein
MSTASNSLDPQVLPPTPESFWAEYKERIKEEGTWEAYHAKKSTTPWTVVIERATLKPWRSLASWRCERFMYRRSANLAGWIFAYAPEVTFRSQWNMKTTTRGSMKSRNSIR